MRIKNTPINIYLACQLYRTCLPAKMSVVQKLPMEDTCMRHILILKDYSHISTFIFFTHAMLCRSHHEHHWPAQETIQINIKNGCIGQHHTTWFFYSLFWTNSSVVYCHQLHLYKKPSIWDCIWNTWYDWDLTHNTLSQN